MKILFAAGEAMPYMKTGGLGDVMAALPKCLARQKHEVCVVLPYYKDIRERNDADIRYIGSIMVDLSWRKQYCGIFSAVSEGVRYYFIDNEYYFNRSSAYGQYDDGERFAFFSKAVLDILPSVGFFPQIIHSNDWQTALIPLFLQAFYQDNENYRNIKTVFTIHNVEYQGFCQLNFLSDVCGIPDSFTPMYEFANCINLMKGALVCSDAITTVSPTYAEELHYAFYGHGLESIIRTQSYKLSGILNGIDQKIFNPWSDKLIPFRFDKTRRSGKEKCKQALQRELGLDVNSDAMLVGMVSRLVSHKGLDLLRAVFDDMMKANIQIVILGVGDSQYEDYFRTAEDHYPGRVSAMLKFDNALSHRIYAGCDLLLMPSKSEPCGLSQMIAMRYGTIPLVRETGGLKDTVTPSGRDQVGRGFTFCTYNAHDMLQSFWEAIGCYQNKEHWNRIIGTAMSYDSKWDTSAQAYTALYQKLTDSN